MSPTIPSEAEQKKMAEDSLELMRYFMEITDEAKRRRIIEYARKLVLN